MDLENTLAETIARANVHDFVAAVLDFTLGVGYGIGDRAPASAVAPFALYQGSRAAPRAWL